MYNQVVITQIIEILNLKCPIKQMTHRKSYKHKVLKIYFNINYT